MEKSGFFSAEVDSQGNYDIEYLDDDFANYFSKFISNGVFPNPSTNLQVVQAATPNMSVVVNLGSAFINGRYYENTLSTSVSIGVADGVLNRKDAIFIRFDRLNRKISMVKEAGLASASPAAPSVQRTEDYWDLCIAIINVNAGLSSITNANIEDTRLNSSLCGIVTNVVQTVDSTTLYNQIRSDLSQFKSSSQADFNAWFANINSKLGTEPATSLQQQIDAHSTLISGNTSEIASNKSDIDAHVARNDNPHAVTKVQVGLGNVDNTADANKNVKYANTAGSARASNISMSYNGNLYITYS